MALLEELNLEMCEQGNFVILYKEQYWKGKMEEEWRML